MTPQPGTPLPWKTEDDEGAGLLNIVRAGLPENIYMGVVGMDFSDDEDGVDPVSKADMAYIVHACNSLPALESERDALKERAKDLEGSLDWILDASHKVLALASPESDEFQAALHAARALLIKKGN